MCEWGDSLHAWGQEKFWGKIWGAERDSERESAK